MNELNPVPGQAIVNAYNTLLREIRAFFDRLKALVRQVVQALADGLRAAIRFAETYRGVRRARLRAIHTDYPRRWRKT